MTILFSVKQTQQFVRTYLLYICIYTAGTPIAWGAAKLLIMQVSASVWCVRGFVVHGWRELEGERRERAEDAIAIAISLVRQPNTLPSTAPCARLSSRPPLSSLFSILLFCISHKLSICVPLIFLLFPSFSFFLSLFFLFLSLSVSLSSPLFFLSLPLLP